MFIKLFFSVLSGYCAGLQFEFINPIFEFSKGMNDLHLDEAEYALLIAINIFSAGQFDPDQHCYMVCLLLAVSLLSVSI